jgi:hypothetical protein
MTLTKATILIMAKITAQSTSSKWRENHLNFFAIFALLKRILIFASLPCPKARQGKEEFLKDLFLFDGRTISFLLQSFPLN